MKKRFFVKMTAILLLPFVVLTCIPIFASASDTWWFAPILEAQMTMDREQENGNDGVIRDSLKLDCKSAILIEANTGKVLYEQNPDEALPPASVTKIMTLLLVMEAIEQGKIGLDDQVSVSERAAGMGGSQIFLEVGETMSVEDMIKSVVIASANDAACALAEHVAGSEDAFVKAMNERAAELGMKNTTFENTNGLDDTAEHHLTSARDIAIMSAELIKHKKILEYSSIWMDTVRNGLFGLTNTNRLVRYYKGCTGLKTGSTAKAGFCISATAERDGMHLVAVIMGSPTRDVRNAEAAKLLDFGFANYTVVDHTPEKLQNLKVLGGESESVAIKYDGFSFLTEKGSGVKVEYKITLPESISAPVKKGDRVGEIVFSCGGREVGRADIVADGDVKRIGFFGVFWRMLGKSLMK